MLQRLFTKPIELIINDRTVMFNSIDNFEFVLEARTAIPLDKITETLKSLLSELQLESDAIGVAIEELTKLVSQAPETSSGITMRLKSINSAIFSKDNGWRDIMVSLNDYESLELCKYKQMVLKTYLQYLSNRFRLIRSVQIELEKDQGVEASMLRTSAMEVNEQSDAALRSSQLGMIRIPKGAPVIPDIKEGDKIQFLLAKYKFELLVEDEITFVDSNNVKYPIKPGKNKVGRGQDCSVKLNDEMQEISRVHLVITNHDDKKLELIDLSTHGTHYSVQ